MIKNLKNNWRKQGAESDENEDEDNIDFFNEDEDNIDLFNEDEKEDGGVMYGDYFTNDVTNACNDPNEELAKEEAADDYLQSMMKKMRKRILLRL